MPHNFHLTGQAYVSKAATTGNGSTPNSPAANVADASAGLTAAAQAIIIGTGSYIGGFGAAGRLRAKLIGDGTVHYSANDPAQPGGYFDDSNDFNDITFDNLRLNNYTAGLFAHAGGDAHGIMTLTFTKCFVNNCLDEIGPYRGGYSFTDTIIKDSRFSIRTGANGNAIHINYCILLNTIIDVTAPGTGLGISNTHLMAGSVVKLKSAAELKSLTNCNVEGTFLIAGVAYDYAGALALGLPATNYSFSANYNRPEAEDFTLQLSSPHLEKGIGPAHLRYALMYYVEFDAAPGDACTTANTRLRSTTGQVISFLEISGFTVNGQGGLVIMPNTTGTFEAFYTTDRIRVASVSQPIELLPVLFAGNFNSDFPTTESAFSSAIPNPRNNNVIVSRPYDSGSAGRNPRRLTVQARFSPNLNPDIAATTDWVGGVYYDLEIGRLPTYNAATGLGNGHPGYDTTAANVTQVEARWLQLRFRTSNNYYSR